jgi:hypothetical protein
MLDEAREAMICLRFLRMHVTALQNVSYRTEATFFVTCAHNFALKPWSIGR